MADVAPGRSPLRDALRRARARVAAERFPPREVVQEVGGAFKGAAVSLVRGLRYATGAEVVGKTFVLAEVRLDGRRFRGCTFDRCIIRYGGGPMALHSNIFSNCPFVLDGAAGCGAHVQQKFSTMPANGSSQVDARVGGRVAN